MPTQDRWKRGIQLAQASAGVFVVGLLGFAAGGFGVAVGSLAVFSSFVLLVVALVQLIRGTLVPLNQRVASPGKPPASDHTPAQPAVASKGVSAEARTVLVERASDVRTKRSDFTDDEFNAVRDIYCEDRVQAAGFTYLGWGMGVFGALVFFVGFTWWWLVPAVLTVVMSFGVAQAYWSSDLNKKAPEEQLATIQAFYIERKKAAKQLTAWFAGTIAIALLAFVTVPGREAHEQAIRNAARAALQVKATDSTSTAWDKRLISFLLGPDGATDLLLAFDDIKYVNAYVFSVVYFAPPGGHKEVISWGFLGHVWVP